MTRGATPRGALPIAELPGFVGLLCKGTSIETAALAFGLPVRRAEAVRRDLLRLGLAALLLREECEDGPGEEGAAPSAAGERVERLRGPEAAAVKPRRRLREQVAAGEVGPVGEIGAVDDPRAGAEQRLGEVVTDDVAADGDRSLVGDGAGRGADDAAAGAVAATDAAHGVEADRVVEGGAPGQAEAVVAHFRRREGEEADADASARAPRRRVEQRLEAVRPLDEREGVAVERDRPTAEERTGRQATAGRDLDLGRRGERRPIGRPLLGERWGGDSLGQAEQRERERNAKGARGTGHPATVAEQRTTKEAAEIEAWVAAGLIKRYEPAASAALYTGCQLVAYLEAHGHRVGTVHVRPNRPPTVSVDGFRRSHRWAVEAANRHRVAEGLAPFPLPAEPDAEGVGR
ncbi:MAG: hypothetical protein WD341_06205 [Tistlia sp.]|uniref:hypothetical protein n=1 Tax=Tistlia sp. TaxID=3057121 RepID=UPI0034A268A0